MLTIIINVPLIAFSLCDDFRFFFEKPPQMMILKNKLCGSAARLGNPGRFAPDPVRPLDVSPQRRFAPGRFAPGRFAPLVVSPLVDSPQEGKPTYFVEIYVNS